MVGDWSRASVSSDLALLFCPITPCEKSLEVSPKYWRGFCRGSNRNSEWWVFMCVFFSFQRRVTLHDIWILAIFFSAWPSNQKVSGCGQETFLSLYLQKLEQSRHWKAVHWSSKYQQNTKFSFSLLPLPLTCSSFSVPHLRNSTSNSLPS